MKLNLKNEIPILIFVALPFLYLAYIWNKLPEKVPVHWNIKGEIDRWGDKTELLIIPFLLPLMTYLILLIVPYIDPKKRLKEMGAKYQQLKFILVFFLSVLALFILYTSYNQKLPFINSIFIFIGLLFALLGNYFQTIKPNYFIGIRTPWTLEDETVWKDTHNLGGKLWFVGGILIAVTSYLYREQPNIGLIIFFAIVAVLVVVPIVYSYLRFQRLN